MTGCHCEHTTDLDNTITKTRHFIGQYHSDNLVLLICFWVNHLIVSYCGQIQNTHTVFVIHVAVDDDGSGQMRNDWKPYLYTTWQGCQKGSNIRDSHKKTSKRFTKLFPLAGTRRIHSVVFVFHTRRPANDSEAVSLA